MTLALKEQHTLPAWSNSLLFHWEPDPDADVSPTVFIFSKVDSTAKKERIKQTQNTKLTSAAACRLRTAALRRSQSKTQIPRSEGCRGKLEAEKGTDETSP